MIRTFLVFLLIASIAKAATLATNGTPTDVQAKLNAAVAGDIITIPAGTFVWTAAVSRSDIPANVTIQGAGTSATGGGNVTVIQDNLAGGARLLSLGLAVTGVFRVTGITVQSGTGGTKDGGTVALVGPGTARIDHCHFLSTSSANYQMVAFWGAVFGVMDHCILDFTDQQALYFYNGRVSGGDAVGNFEWTLPTNFGSADYFFIEDNIINGSTTFNSYATRVFDGTSASKVVVRFNTLVQVALGECHATGHAGNDRGLRSQEIYGNFITSALAVENANFAGIDCSSGTALGWGNNWNNSGNGVYKHPINFNVTRKNNDTYAQSPTPTGWGYAGTQFNGTGSNWDGGTFNATDTLLGYPCLDQPGRGQGDLLVGDHPTKVNQTTGTIRWPNQTLEPIYFWANVGNEATGFGGAYFNNNTGGRVVANRDYYAQASGIQTTPTSPFNGTSGTGWGTLANRPTTCTTGVAYFATDQGSWNQSSTNPRGVQQNGADGVLYKATATNTWTLYYTPYAYPHPLQAVAPASATVGTVNATTLTITNN